MKTGRVIAEEDLPKGTWRKTHRVPKPVGVPLWIKDQNGIYEDVHTGNPTFELNGKTLLNTVYSYNTAEEWLDCEMVEK